MAGKDVIGTRGLLPRLRVAVCAIAAASMLAVGAGQAAVADGGVELSARSSAPDENWSNLAYGNGSLGSGDVTTSPDGIDWTQTRDADDGWSDVDYGNGVFVALALAHLHGFAVDDIHHGVT